MIVVEGGDAPATPAPAPTPAPAAEAVAPPEDPADEIVDVHELEDAPADNRTGVDQLTQAFPGAELLAEDGGG